VGKEEPPREPPSPDSPGPAAGAGERSEEERVLRCARCGHALARARDAIEVSGAHVHEFSNPSGVAYRIGCFAAAPGCAAFGDPETFFSWFPGHAWQIAVCAACAQHVGWSFTRETGGFYGLILARLAE
jgi:hypothetical protein